MDRASRVFLLFVIAVVICSFTGSIGGLVVYYGLGAPDLWSAMVMFGMADALGIMIFAPLILAWSEFEVRSLASASPRRIAEIAIIVAVGVMMFAAKPIGDFVDRHPTVKMLALSFLILIGVALVAEGGGYHIPKGYIYFAMAFSVGVEMLNLRMRARKEELAGEMA